MSYGMATAKACPQSMHRTPVLVRHTNLMFRAHPIQYKPSGPVKRKRYIGESVPQLSVSMRAQERVSASIDSSPFFRI